MHIEKHVKTQILMKMTKRDNPCAIILPRTAWREEPYEVDFCNNKNVFSTSKCLEKSLNIKFLKMGPRALGKVPGPFGSILVRILASKTPNKGQKSKYNSRSTA